MSPGHSLHGLESPLAGERSGTIRNWPRQGEIGVALLTQREIEVLTGVAHGLNNRDIGAELGISSRTAEVHRASVLRKLRARSSAHAVFIALELSLLTVNSSTGATASPSRGERLSAVRPARNSPAHRKALSEA